MGCLGGRKTAQEKNKFLGTEVPRNFSDQCSLDFAYFLSFQWDKKKSSQELCSWELFFFLILGGFSPSECLGSGKGSSVSWVANLEGDKYAECQAVLDGVPPTGLQVLR